MSYLTILFALMIAGWAAAALIGAQAYFRGEQSKPIHERNWNSAEFDQLATSVTGQTTDYSDRRPAYEMDAYATQAFTNV